MSTSLKRSKSLRAYNPKTVTVERLLVIKWARYTRDLYDTLEHLPLPDDLTEEEKDVYEEMVKERIAVLLRKAVRI